MNVNRCAQLLIRRRQRVKGDVGAALLFRVFAFAVAGLATSAPSEFAPVPWSEGNP